MPMKAAKKQRVEVLAGPGAPQSKADHAYAVIRQQIIDGTSAPGDRLLIEHLARQINVSVVPVREAIRRLEAEGLVTFTRNVGATVTSIDLERYPETIEAVAVLEGVATGLAAPHITASDLKKARALNEDMRRSIGKLDPVTFTRTNAQFHSTLYERCPNRHLLNMVVKEWALLDTTRRSGFEFVPERAARSVEEHEALLRLIEERRPGEEVEAYARRHRMRTARRVLQQLGDNMEAAESIEARS
jgi:DNA-binding GntR family transcriptional regulator